MGRKLFYKSMSLIKRLQDPYYQGAAAEMGFYFIFSIVPIITILTQILGYAGVTGIFSELLESISSLSSARCGLHRKSNFL